MIVFYDFSDGFDNLYTISASNKLDACICIQRNNNRQCIYLNKQQLNDLIHKLQSVEDEMFNK